MLQTRIEIVPAPGIVPKVKETIPLSTALAVSTPPSLGIAKTMQTAMQLTALGYQVIPHLPAHEMHSRTQLASIVRMCLSLGITEVLAVRGDSVSPEGPYRSSLDLMEDIAEASGGNVRVAVAGYPEAHPFVSTLHLLDSLLAKCHLATHIVTQMCFAAPTIITYAEILRRERVTLPIWAGVPGPVPKGRLLPLASRIGVGPSLKYLSRSGPLGRRVLRNDRYSPGWLISDLEASPEAFAGIHMHSFNELDSLPFHERLGSAPIHGNTDAPSVCS